MYSNYQVMKQLAEVRDRQRLDEAGPGNLHRKEYLNNLKTSVNLMSSRLVTRMKRQARQAGQPALKGRMA